MTDLKLQSTAQLEEMTGIPAGTWRFWRHCGDGPPSVRLGKRIYYRESDVLEWLERKFEAEQQKRVSA